MRYSQKILKLKLIKRLRKMSFYDIKYTRRIYEGYGEK